MTEITVTRPVPPGAVPDRPAAEAAFRRVCACVDLSPLARKVVWHAAALAQALGAELVLLHVVEENRSRASPADPVECALRREKARATLETLSRDCAKGVRKVSICVLEGGAADQICTWGQANGIDITVACTHRIASACDCDLGGTVRALVECANESLLLVPADVPEAPVAPYKNLIVPLDGSSRAESALPLAIRLSASTNGTIRLVHAVPEPGLTVTGPLDPEDIELRERIVKRNERVARDYLKRISERITGRAKTVRTMLLRGGDARHVLCRAMDPEVADLIVLASHGHSGHPDTSTGSVASHLLARASLPLLLVRDGAHLRERVAAFRQRARIPERASV